MKKLNIYVVEHDEKPGEIRLIEAASPSAAIRQSYPKLTARLAKRHELIQYLPTVKVEYAATKSD